MDFEGCGSTRRRPPFTAGKIKTLAGGDGNVNENRARRNNNQKIFRKRFLEESLLLFADNSNSDAEFLLPYDTFTLKNPDFLYDKCKRFNLDSLNAAECKAEFRVKKQDLPRLVQALQLPPVFKKRIAYQCSDMIPRFVLFSLCAESGDKSRCGLHL